MTLWALRGAVLGKVQGSRTAMKRIWRGSRTRPVNENTQPYFNAYGLGGRGSKLTALANH